MRIIFLTDIHDDFQGVERVLLKLKADLYLLAGDLVYKIFPTQATAWRFLELQERLRGMNPGAKPGSSLFELALERAKAQPPDSFSQMARDYLELCEVARTRMLDSYKKLARILHRQGESLIRVLPGNYDMDLSLTPLSPWNLHMQFLDLGGIRIAGYGGAKVLTPGVPEHLQVRFEEGPGPRGLSSAPLEFFRKATPQVLVVHQPPHGLLDKLDGQGPSGSLGIRQYLEEARPLAVLCGHMHRQWGAVRLGDTWCLNPSNFGRVEEVSGVRTGGHFLDLGLDSKGVSWAMIRTLKKDRILDVVHYQPKGQRIRQVILEETRFKALGGSLRKPKHARPFDLLQQIRSFFLRHETPSSKALVAQLRAVYRGLESQGLRVGFDLLGSLGLGMASEGSDMDLVVYLRGLGCDPDDQDVCRAPGALSRVMGELASRGIKAEVCDSIDLDRVEKAIARQDREDSQLQRFVFYRAVCRAVNLRLVKEVENKLLGKERLRRSVEKRLQEHLRILVSSGRHLESWEKYKKRLQEKGVDMPPRIQQALREYLGS